MIFSASTNYKFFLEDYKVQQDRLAASMRRIASGKRFIAPGEAPADSGISARFKAQVVNTEEASRVIQNAVNLFQTSDAFMQSADEILNRMSELAISAVDSSKNQGDRENLDLEFQQLKSELARISEAGKYNGLQINGKTSVAVWDAFDEQIVYYQPDGTGERRVEYVMSDEAGASNGLNYNFVSPSGVTGDFTFSSDGKSLYYYAQDSDLNDNVSITSGNTLMKLDLDTDTLLYLDMVDGEADATRSNTLKIDADGNVWTSYRSTNGVIRVAKVRENELSLDKGGAASTNEWAGGVSIASAFPKSADFAINEDYIYYIERDGTTKQYVRQNLYDVNTKETLVEDVSAFGLVSAQTAGQSYVISSDGRYLAYEGQEGEADEGTLYVLDTHTNKRSSLIVGTTSQAVTGLGFDFNNRLYWTNTGSINQQNSISKVAVTTAENGDPDFGDVQILANGNMGRFGARNEAIASSIGGGLSITAGSPATNYQFQTGPDAEMHVEMSSADIRLFTLGISKDSVSSIEEAEAAIDHIDQAINKLSQQRATIGAQVNRLSHTLSTNQSYATNISAAQSRIEDADIAEESAKVANQQILSQVATQMLQFNNQNRMQVLNLLQFL